MMHLVWLDWVLVIIAGSFILKNIRKNFLFQIISLFGWFLIFYTVFNYDDLVVINSDWFNFLSEKYRVLACQLVVFIATIIIFNLLASIVDILFSPEKKYVVVEHIFGVCSGILKCCTLSYFMIYNFNDLLDEKILQTLDSSYLLPMMQEVSVTISKYVFMLTEIF